MRKSVIVLIISSTVTIAALVSVSFGLSHAQAMRETGNFSGMTGHQLSQDSSTECDKSMLSQMNMTQHMNVNMHDGHANMHNQLNMTEHMQDMHEEHGDMMTPHTGNEQQSCHS